MESRKTFLVFGEKVEVLVSGEVTNGDSAMMIQTSPPGGGPPPHRHLKEDEFFCVLEGRFEMLTEGQWNPVPKERWCLPRVIIGILFGMPETVTAECRSLSARLVWKSISKQSVP